MLLSQRTTIFRPKPILGFQTLHICKRTNTPPLKIRRNFKNAPKQSCKANSNLYAERPPAPQVLNDNFTQEKLKAVDPPTFVTAEGRVVAVGDLHGDYQKAIDCLVSAGVIEIESDGNIQWIGGNTVVVQLGDVLGRGPHEIGIIQLLRYLDGCARKQGGAVYMLNGNHEFMNVCGSYKYVHKQALQESGRFAGLLDEELHQMSTLVEARNVLFRPGGAMAMELSKNPSVLVVNDTVFAHGALFPEHVEFGLEKINNAVACWMRGDSAAHDRRVPSLFLASGGRYSIMWSRVYSSNYPPQIQQQVCGVLEEALTRLRAKRLVVGHTIQPDGINCACEGRVWRIDVGMSLDMLNRPAEWLEIRRVRRNRGNDNGNGNGNGNSLSTDAAGPHQVATSHASPEPASCAPSSYASSSSPFSSTSAASTSQTQDSNPGTLDSGAGSAPTSGYEFRKIHREPVDNAGEDGIELETVVTVHGDRSAFETFRKELEATAVL